METLSPKTKKQRNPPVEIEVLSDVRDGSYWHNVNGRFVALKKSELKMHLISLGMDEGAWHDADKGRLDEFNWILWNAQRNNMIDYAGALAGHRKGKFTDGSGRTYLVTDEAAGIFDKLEKNSAPKFFETFVEELLPEGQWQLFCTWLAIALRSLRKGDMRPGQVVVLAGAAGCGKSLLQAIVTEILGGRSANPFRYMMDLTQFNKDLIGAEHWPIEDPPSTTDIRTRRQFGAKLKEATVNRDFSIHAKGKDALTLRIFRRVTISINDEPENLAVIPPFDPSIEDKIFLFHCATAAKCFLPFRDDPNQLTFKKLKKPTGDIDRAAVWNAVLAEIPAIRAWLLNEFKTVPHAMRDDRFGIKAWHHPVLRAELVSLAPETRLLQLVDDALWHDAPPHAKFDGKSSDLEKLLRKSDVAFETEKILRFVGACGSYLGKLAKSHPQRVSKRILDGTSLWTIQPPSKTKE